MHVATVGFGAQETRSPLRKDRVMEGLSPRMEAYARARVAGAGKSEAYRSAYNCTNQLDSTVATSAAELEAHPKVVARTRDLVAQRDAQTSHAPAVGRDWVMTGLVKIANDEDQKTSDRIRCYELVGKSAGIDLFRDVTVHEKTTRTVEEIEREIRDRLAKAGVQIDGQSRDVTVLPSVKD